MAKKTAPLEIRNRITGMQFVKGRDLQDNAGNFRLHPQHQREAMAGVLKEIGIVGALLVYQSARQGGLTVIDGHLRKGDFPEQEWPCLMTDLDDAEADYILLMYDELSRQAEREKEQVAALINRVQSGEAAVQAMVSRMAEDLGILLDTTPASYPVGDAPEPEIDRVEELRQKWGTAEGQLWQVGCHRMLCGDCLKLDNLQKLTQTVRADMLLNDPPYGMQLDADFSGMQNRDDFAQAKGIKAGRKYRNVIGDQHNFDATPLINFFHAVPEQFWFGADYYAVSLGDTSHAGSWLVWDKRIDETMDKMFGSCFELIWSRQKHKRDILRHKWAGIFGTEHEPQRGRYHPNQKPVVLLTDMICRYTETGAVVTDCFAGAGSTLIACEKTERQCFCCEIDPGYVAVALQRWADMTGETPRLL